jgi:hypothetical protein
MARQKTTPGDELAAKDEQIAELVREGEALSSRQGDAESLLRSYEDRRAEALKLRKLGEAVDVPDEAEQARLGRAAADAKEEQNTIRAVRLVREEERLKIIAGGLSHFDAEAEESARAYEALGETLLAALADFQAGGQAKGAGWGRSRTGRKELGCDLPPGIGSRDLDHLRTEITDAIRTAWPAESEERWREFVKREQAPPAGRLSNAEAIARFGGEAA